MAEKHMLDLEQASQIVLAPPDVVSGEQRQAAEDVIIEFRKTKLPYNHCRYILEHSKNDYVLFQVATTIKEAIVREWSLLSADDIESLRSFLLRYITKHISLQSYVREQILQTVAVILKRGTLDHKGATCDSLFGDVTQLIGSGNVTMQLVACSMLTALLNEYSSSSRMSNVGFTWEFHIRCKHAFEERDLKRVFLFCLQVLEEIDKQPSPLTREATAVLNRVLSITESVLCWEFTPKCVLKKRVGSFEANQNVSLKPSESWRDTFLDSGILALFFKIHKKARHNSEMAHHSMQCISQLASLNGAIFPSDKARIEYLTHFIKGFLHLLASMELQDYESLGVANTFKSLVMMFPQSCRLALSNPLLEDFVSQMTRLTVAMGQEAAQEEAKQKEDTIHMEAYEKMLETWMELTPDVKALPEGVLKPQAREVFNAYMRCHLSPPDGTRAQDQDECNEEEEIDELEEDDREKFKDQLCGIGALGRIVPEHSIVSLARVLEDRVGRLQTQLQRLQQQRLARGPHDATFDFSSLTSIHEDLHWMLLVAANVLTEEAEGETPMIPADVMAHSIKQGANTDPSISLQVLVTPFHSSDITPQVRDKASHVVRLVAAVLRLCEVESWAVEAKLSDCLSPQVLSSAMWFLRRWSRAYLLPDETFYAQTSLDLSVAFGRDTEGAQWLLDFLLQKVLSSLSVWSSEEGVMIDSLSLLVNLVENKAKAEYVMKSEWMLQLAQLEAENMEVIRNLSPASHHLLMKALILAASGLDSEHREKYWTLVLQSVHNRFYGVICQENFGKLSQTRTCMESIKSILESLLGITEATRVDNMARLFEFIQPILHECVKLIDLYHNYEDIIPLLLKLFSETVHRHLCYLGPAKSQLLYQLCLSAIQAYSKYNKEGRTVDSEEEEDKFHDILIVMELLTHLLTKDYIDLAEEEREVLHGNPMGAVDVVLYGLNIIIPIMNAELLKFPTLCSNYFKLVTFLGEVHPEKFSQLPEELFHSLMVSIEMGLSSFGPDITTMCLDILTALATEVFQQNQHGSPLHQALGHFLKLVFHMLLLETFDMDLLQSASAALFCLICIHQEGYRELVNGLLNSPHLDSEYHQRLLDAFNKLTPPSLQLNVTRANKTAFMHNFSDFLIDVRGFLCVR